MKLYQFVDYSCIEEAPARLVEYVTVSSDNISRIRKTVPNDQREFVEDGDELCVYVLGGTEGDGRRRLTVWFNKEMAAVETGDGSVWGDWDEDEELLTTEELEKGEDAEGSVILGRKAYNIYGHCGIYAAGKFYTLVDGLGNSA